MGSHRIVWVVGVLAAAAFCYPGCGGGDNGSFAELEQGLESPPLK